MAEIRSFLASNFCSVALGIVYFILIGKDIQRSSRNEQPQWGRPSLYGVYAGIGLLPCFVNVCLMVLWNVYPHQVFVSYEIWLYLYLLLTCLLFYISGLWLLPHLYIIKDLSPTLTPLDSILTRVVIQGSGFGMVLILLAFTMILQSPLRAIADSFEYRACFVVIGFSLLVIPIGLIQRNLSRFANQEPKK